MKLTAEEWDVLENAKTFADCYPDQWARPMDLGGFDGSWHSRIAAKLAAKSLLERRDRGSLTGRRAVWLYRITEAGRLVLQGAEHDQ